MADSWFLVAPDGLMISQVDLFLDCFSQQFLVMFIALSGGYEDDLDLWLLH